MGTPMKSFEGQRMTLRPIDVNIRDLGHICILHKADQQKMGGSLLQRGGCTVERSAKYRHANTMSRPPLLR